MRQYWYFCYETLIDKYVAFLPHPFFSVLIVKVIGALGKGLPISWAEQTWFEYRFILKRAKKRVSSS